MLGDRQNCVMKGKYMLNESKSRCCLWPLTITLCNQHVHHNDMLPFYMCYTLKSFTYLVLTVLPHFFNSILLHIFTCEPIILASVQPSSLNALNEQAEGCGLTTDR